MDAHEYNIMNTLISRNSGICTLDIHGQTRVMVKMVSEIIELIRPINLQLYLLEECSVKEDYISTFENGVSTYWIREGIVWELYSTMIMRRICSATAPEI